MRRDHDRVGDARLRCGCGATTPRGIVTETEAGYELFGLCYGRCYADTIRRLARSAVTWRWATATEVRLGRPITLDNPRWRNVAMPTAR